MHFAISKTTDSNGDSIYSLTGSETPIAPFLAPGVNVEINGRGGNDTLSVGSGAIVTLLNDAGADGTALGVTAESGSQLDMASSEHLASLTLLSGSSAQVNADGTYNLVLGTLSISGSHAAWTSSLDLTDNNMIVRNTASWSPTYPANVEAIYQQIQDGAIYSSLPYGIFLRNSGSPTTFDGESLGANDALVQNIGGYGYGGSNGYGSAYGSVSSTWGSSSVTFTPTIYSNLPSNTIWQVDWGDGTLQTITGATPGNHNYTISEGNIYVGMIAYSGGSYYYPAGAVLYAPPEYALTITSSTTPSLPTPATFSFTTPTGTDTFSPPVSGSSVSTSAPEIDQSTTTAAPGAVIALTVENYNASATSFWVYGQTNSGNATLEQATVVLDSTNNTSGTTGSTTVVSVRLPNTLTPNSAYLIWGKNSAGFGAPFVINAPQIEWDGENNINAGEPLAADYFSGPFIDPSAYAGEKISLFGQNLSQDNSNQPYNDQSWVYLFNSSGGVAAVINATAVAPNSNTGAGAMDVNSYKLDFIMASVPAGTYDVKVYNGHGGEYALSNSIQIGVGSTPTALDTVVLSQTWLNDNGYSSDSLYEGDGSINPTAVNDAISWANSDWANVNSMGGLR